jgi:flavin-dependent dehydrogenase
MTYDVAIVGGGPAGLAAAIQLSARGLACAVFDRRPGPIDKACGEGLMPPGLKALKAMEVEIAGTECAPFTAIRYVQEDGRYVEAALPEPGGLGVRRLALHQALTARAKAAGAELRELKVLGHRDLGDEVELDTEAGSLRARLLVAADGLHSAIRKQAGLELHAFGPRRYGIRRHFAVSPWGQRVEVHFAPGLEAYLTPAGANRIGLAFLWEDGEMMQPVSFDALLSRFPLLERQLQGAVADSKPMGAGPLLQRTRRLQSGRVVLLGDAAGYVDAITGEGLSLAFDQARRLAATMPVALADPRALVAYERESLRAFRAYARLASSLVALARRPTLRRAALDGLIAAPGVFRFLLRHFT